MGIEMGNSNVTDQKEHESYVIQDLNKLSEDANDLIPAEVVLQEDSFVVPRLDINSNGTEELENEHQIWKQEYDSEGKDEETSYSTVLLELEESKTYAQEKITTISSAEDENRIELQEETRTVDSNGTKDAENLKYEMAEPVDDSVPHDFTTDYKTSNEMVTKSSELETLTLCGAKEETQQGDDTAMRKDGELEVKEEPEEGKVVTAMSTTGMNTEEDVGNIHNAFKLDSLDNGPSKLESSPSVELFYLEAIDMEIERASQEIVENEYKIKSNNVSDLSAEDSTVNTVKERNELGKKEEVRAPQSEEEEIANDCKVILKESFRSQVPCTIQEDLEEEIDMIEIPASSSMILDLYPEQEQRTEKLNGLLGDNYKLSDISSLSCVESDEIVGAELIKGQAESDISIRQEEDLDIVDKSAVIFREANLQEHSQLIDPSSLDSDEQDKHSVQITSCPLQGSPQLEQNRVDKPEREDKTAQSCNYSSQSIGYSKQLCNYSSQLIGDSNINSENAFYYIQKDLAPNGYIAPPELDEKQFQNVEQPVENVEYNKLHQEQAEFQILIKSAITEGKESNSEEAHVEVPTEETEVLCTCETSGLKGIDSGRMLGDVESTEKTTCDKIVVDKQETHLLKENVNGACKSPAKKTISTSADVREKQRSRSSIFSSCICCTTVIQ